MEPTRLRWAVGAVLALLVVAGGAVRLAAGADAGHRLYPDERSYGRLATGLADRGDYGEAGSEDRTRWAPGTPVAFAVADRLLPGARGPQAHELRSARTFQALASTLLIPAAFGVAALLAGPAAGLVAAALIAAYPPLTSVVNYQVSEPLAALLVLAAVLAVAAGGRAPREREAGTEGAGGRAPRGAVAWAAAAGALLGLAVLTRADLLVPVLAAGPALWWAARREGGRRRGLALTLATLLVIAPWVAFASLNRGRLVPVSGGGPGTLFMGTYLPGDGTVIGFKRGLAAEARSRYPDLRAVSPLRMPAGRVLDAVAARRPGEPRDAALLAEALANVRRYALGDPTAYAAMTVGKVVRLWSRPFQTPQPAIIAVHLLLLAAGLAGLVLGLRRSEPVAVVLAAIVALSTLDNMVLVPEPRHNMPLYPALLAVGVAGLAAAARARAVRSPGTAARRRPRVASGARPSR